MKPAFGLVVVSTSDPLADHGDKQVPAGALDLAVNVVADTPGWLREEFTHLDLSRYPSSAEGAAAAATRHGLTSEECLLTNGAAEAFWALAYGLRPRLAACVHPSFTAPEAALRAAGVPVHQVIRRADDDFALDVSAIPDEADLVVLGRPDNPTGRVETAEVVASLTRPGRTVVLDEAFADFLPSGDSLISHRLPGVVCVRSLTKLWGLAGIRVGYLLGPALLLNSVASALQPWPVNALAAHAVRRLSGRDAERRARADQVADSRAALVRGLSRVHDLRTWPSPANFVLVRGALPSLRDRLLDHGIATRRCATFPGLDDSYIRIAVPMHPRPREQLLAALHEVTSANGVTRTPGGPRHSHDP